MTSTQTTSKIQDESRVLLIILDGFGEGPSKKGNAVEAADMTFYKSLKADHPWTTLKAAGNAVGLPKGFQGNSEVGHFTIGSGRITFQSFESINRSIQEGDFFKKEALVEACERVKKDESSGSKRKRALHLLGMISDEGVHADLNHLFALLKLAKENEAFPIYIHAILDGRDVPERSADEYLTRLQKKLDEMGLNKPLDPTQSNGPQKATLATMAGRYYTMDRDANWDRTQQAYELLIDGKGVTGTDPVQALKEAYNKGAETDYYVPPICFDSEGTIQEGDSVIFFNFRTDRARQITQALINKNFKEFDTTHGPIHFVAMGPYTEDAPVVFPCPAIKNNLGKVLSKNKIPQLRIAETEKYAHVTYFLNSQIEDPEPLEERIMIPSPKCASYAEQPEMSAKPLTERLIQEISQEKYRFIAVNYANTDLVGHSGELEATIECCKIMDGCLEKLIPAAQAHGYTTILTADHGNAEDMLYDDGSPRPSHTENDVVGMVIAPSGQHAAESNEHRSSTPHSIDSSSSVHEQMNSRQKAVHKLKSNRGLQDIAPTILHLLDLEKPTEMTGESLI